MAPENNEKKAPMVCETIGAGGEQLSWADVMLSNSDFTTDWRAAQGVSALLLPGSENAINLQHLMKITGLDAREIRKLIHRERLAGIPILANMKSGFFLASSEGERAWWVKTMLHRACEIERAARAVEMGRLTHGEE